MFTCNLLFILISYQWIFPYNIFHGIFVFSIFVFCYLLRCRLSINEPCVSSSFAKNKPHLLHSKWGFQPKYNLYFLWNLIILSINAKKNTNLLILIIWLKKPENNLFLSLFTKRFLVFYCVSAKIQKLFAKKLFSNKIIGYNWANVCIISTSSLKCAKISVCLFFVRKELF